MVLRGNRGDRADCGLLRNPVINVRSRNLRGEASTFYYT